MKFAALQQLGNVLPVGYSVVVFRPVAGHFPEAWALMPCAAHVEGIQDPQALASIGALRIRPSVRRSSGQIRLHEGATDRDGEASVGPRNMPSTPSKGCTRHAFPSVPGLAQARLIDQERDFVYPREQEKRVQQG